MSDKIASDTLEETPQSKKLNYDLILTVTFMGVVSMSLLWSMSAGGSYWRPDAAAGLPLPGYIGAKDLRQVPATVPTELGNIDAETANRVADAPRGVPRTTMPASFDVVDEADFVVASLPTSLPSPASLRDSEADMAADADSNGPLDLFIAPESPAQPRIVASEDTEKALELNRAARFGVQRRLVLAGFNPNGIDGVFGPRTRAAIAGFQTARGFPATGYLEPSVYSDLKQRTEDAYQILRRQRAAARSVVPDLAPATEEPLIASANGEVGCVRHSNGRIIEYQSLACDFAGFHESFASPSRSTLENGDDTGADR
jgi:hypothetical protein